MFGTHGDDRWRCPEPSLVPPERPRSNKDRLHEEYEALSEKRKETIRSLSQTEDLMEELAGELGQLGACIVVHRLTR